jgi:hypothetical protein
MSPLGRQKSKCRDCEEQEYAKQWKLLTRKTVDHMWRLCRVGYCEHGRRKGQCKQLIIFDNTGKDCAHGSQKAQCRIDGCGESSYCHHDRKRADCKVFSFIFIRAFVSTKETKEIVEIAKEIGYVIMGNERVAASIVADLTYAFTKDKKINVRNLNI